MEKTMGEKIKQILSGLPEAPGVYCMRNAEGRIVYIGKSKCLKKRVNSYFVKNPKWDKAQKMVPFIEDHLKAIQAAAQDFLAKLLK